MSKKRGINKRPDFASADEVEFFEKTPKRVLFELLRDCCIQLVSLEQDGYAEEWFLSPELWVDEARKRIGTAV